MKPIACCLLLIGIWTAVPDDVSARSVTSFITVQDDETAEKAFKAGNAYMEQKKFAEALAEYKKVLAEFPNETSTLFNGGMAAFLIKDYETAADLWRRFKVEDHEDWHIRAKLVQVYQALGKRTERDNERSELLKLREAGKNGELSEQVEYCRDQFEVGGRKVMAFELFEFKGDRPVRYVFRVLNDEGAEAWRISLGSYNSTNAVWRETTTPKPKDGVRLFHLDGYFPDGHATFNMYVGEPAYDEIRGEIIKILEGKQKAVTRSTTGNSDAQTGKSPKP